MIFFELSNPIVSILFLLKKNESLPFPHPMSIKDVFCFNFLSTNFEKSEFLKFFNSFL